MTSIVIHYKELALKGRNRPWFVKILIRNLRTALADLDIRSIRSVMGRIEVDLGAATSWESVRDRVRQVFGIANFSYAARAPHDFDDARFRDPRRPGRSRRGLVPRVGARRADKRMPFTSPEIEREVGGRIKEAKGWRVDLDDAGPDDPPGNDDRITPSISSGRSPAPADCRPAPAAASRASFRAASTRRWRPSG